MKWAQFCFTVTLWSELQYKIIYKNYWYFDHDFYLQSVNTHHIWSLQKIFCHFLPCCCTIQCQGITFWNTFIVFVWSIFYNSCPAGAVLLSTKVSCESENFQLFVVEKMYHLLLSIYLSPASQGRREVGAGLGADKARVSVRSLVASSVE